MYLHSDEEPSIGLHAEEVTGEEGGHSSQSCEGNHRSEQCLAWDNSGE